ncbi:MAG: glycosyltransferase family 9 protein [Bacteroidetes bacterium]|nr:glycosyltransferase family 9 protein [Bacteroidota bacterium]
MRYQALGDLMIILPYLQSLKVQLPHTQFHLLTRTEVALIPENLLLFDKVISIGGGRNAKLQFVIGLLLLPRLWWQGYKVVADLQNHRISKIMRKLLFPVAWCEFDRSSKNYAGERTRATLETLGLGKVEIFPSLNFRRAIRTDELLRRNGYEQGKNLVVINPAGAFVSRQWPIENYIAFCRLWQEKYTSTQFVILGLKSIRSKAVELKNAVVANLIDLTEQTSTLEAFAIVAHASLVLTEDSGLMHMAWVQGRPTLALFGSSPSYWSSPLGAWSRCLNSSDLPCGDCFSDSCRFGDVHCLTRYSPTQVFHEAELLLSTVSETNRTVS